MIPAESKNTAQGGYLEKKSVLGSVPTGFSGRCPFLSMSFTDRSDAHTEPVGPCLKNDTLVVKLIHPHVTPGPYTSECKASDCPKTVTVGPSWPARLGILPIPDMCAHLNDTLCTRQELHSMQPGHSKANEEATLPSPLDPQRGQGRIQTSGGDSRRSREKRVPVELRNKTAKPVNQVLRASGPAKKE